MVLNVIAGYLLAGTPVVNSGQIIRGVPRTSLAALNEGAATAQRRASRRWVKQAPSRLVCEGVFSKLAGVVRKVAQTGSSWATRNASSVPHAPAEAWGRCSGHS
jgi:hypothetical protein